MGERSAVLRNLITNACPPTYDRVNNKIDAQRKRYDLPIALAEPGSTKAVVTPPEIDRGYAASRVLRPSKLLI